VERSHKEPVTKRRPRQSDKRERAPRLAHRGPLHRAEFGGVRFRAWIVNGKARLGTWGARSQGDDDHSRPLVG
jgi:hypothetical protein